MSENSGQKCIIREIKKNGDIPKDILLGSGMYMIGEPIILDSTVSTSTP